MVQTETENISILEASQLLGVNAMTVRRLIAAGTLRALKNAATRRVVIPRADIEAEQRRRSEWLPVDTGRSKTRKRTKKALSH